jgi:hypothetical protein
LITDFSNSILKIMDGAGAGGNPGAGGGFDPCECIVRLIFK